MRKWLIFALLLCAVPVHSQTTVNGRVQTGLLANKPATCNNGDQYNSTDSVQIQICQGGVWVVQTAGTGASVSANNAFTGNNTHSGQEAFSAVTSLNNVTYWDGLKYPFTTTGLQAAITAGCNGTIPGKIILPPFVANALITSTITFPSNCWIDGAGKLLTVLQAAAGLAVPVANAIGVSHLRLTNFGIDGNRSNNGGTNPNSFDCLDIGTTATDVTVDSVRTSNCRNNGMLVAASDTDITVMNSESDHNGADNINSIGTAGINVGPGSGFEKRIHLGPHDRIHDNNSGVVVTNSTNSVNLVSDVSIVDDFVFASGNDAISITAPNLTGGKIVNATVLGNQTFCNGDSTTLFPAVCVAGFYQTHTINTGGGVGVDIITNADQLIIQPVVSSNNSHDNTYEGVAMTANVTACVTVSTLTTVTQVAPGSGGCTAITANQPFKTSWKSGESIAISTVLYRISSCASTTVCTLLDNAVNGANQAAGLPSYMWGIISDNSVYDEGNNSFAGGVGPGMFCQLSDGNVYTGNTMRLNNFEGLELFGCSFTTSQGNHSFSNNTSNTANRSYGLASYGGLANSFVGDVADDPGAVGHQNVGVYVGTFAGSPAAATGNLIASPSLYGSFAPVLDTGSGTRYLTSVFSTNGVITGITAGDVGAARTATTGAYYLGTDGNCYLFRSGSTDMVTGPTCRLDSQTFIANQGNPCTNGELALSGGWQSTGAATVTAVTGTGQTCSWTITTGTTTAANPTVTDTLTNPLPSASTVCSLVVNGGTHTATFGAGTSDTFRQTTLSATAPVFTYNETPTAGGTTYFVTRQCGP